MSLRLVTPAATKVVTLAEAKKQCNVLHDEDDEYFNSLIAAADDWLAGERSWLGRAVVSSTWECTASAFPVSRVDLPKPPLISVTSVNYTPAGGGAEVEITGFRVIDANVPAGGYLLPAKNTDWPQTDGEPGSVRIVFVAGYAAVPPSVNHAARLMIAHWYENREAATSLSIKDLPLAVDSLLYPYRNWPG